MSAAALEQLYDRYKRAALATGATLLLDADPAPLAAVAADLLTDSRAALDGADSAEAVPLAACVRASADLHALLSCALSGGPIGATDTDRVRASHRELRQEVWKIIPCEYVPCSAPYRHDHERDC
jgi:hypothetical protein